MTLFEHTLKITEKNIMAEINYGMALLEAGRAKEAIEHFNNVLRINKSHVNAYVDLGIAYNRLGRNDMAIRNYTKALELKPDTINALNNLALTLVTAEDTSLRDANKAIDYARRACELTGNKDAVYLDTLAVTYAAAGRFDEAKTTAQKALKIAKETGRDKLVVAIQERIKFYEAGQPYQQK
jgi:Flp pilus assembly protein TadD